MAYSKDVSTLFTSANDHCIKVWRMEDMQLIRNMPGQVRMHAERVVYITVVARWCLLRATVATLSSRHSAVRCIARIAVHNTIHAALQAGYATFHAHCKDKLIAVTSNTVDIHTVYDWTHWLERSLVSDGIEDCEELVRTSQPLLLSRLLSSYSYSCPFQPATLTDRAGCNCRSEI